jgi:hypothetical protein
MVPETLCADAETLLAASRAEGILPGDRASIRAQV